MRKGQEKERENKERLRERERDSESRREKLIVAQWGRRRGKRRA